MGWLIAAAILILIGILPLGVLGVYQMDGPALWLTIWFLKIPVYPAEKKDKENKKQKKKPEDQFAKTKTVKKGGSFAEFLPLLENILGFLNDCRRKLYVKDLQMKLIMAGSDPCDLAIHYGRAWAALGNLMPRLEQVFRIGRRNLEVACDFTADQTLIDVRIHITITVFRILQLGFVHGIGILKKYMMIANQQKGGASNHE